MRRIRSELLLGFVRFDLSAMCSNGVLKLRCDGMCWRAALGYLFSGLPDGSDFDTAISIFHFLTVLVVDVVRRSPLSCMYTYTTVSGCDLRMNHSGPRDSSVPVKNRVAPPPRVKRNPICLESSLYVYHVLFVFSSTYKQSTRSRIE